MFHLRLDMPFYFMSFYGSLMMVIIFFVRLVIRKKLPKFVIPILWCMVLFRLLVPFSLSSPISLPVPEWQFALEENEKIIYMEGISHSTAADTDKGDSNGNEIGYITDSTVNSGSHRFYPTIDVEMLVVIYTVGAAATAGLLLFQKYCYTRKLKNSLLLEQNEVINNVLDEMRMKHVLVLSNDEIATPLVCGLFRQKIYLPARMDFRNKELLGHIIQHEAIHIKHRDNLIKAVMILALCLNWYNPMIWFMSKCLSSDLEAACDAAVLKCAAVDQRQSYAGSLLAMAIAGNKTTLLYSAFSRTEVERRIKDVLRYKKATTFALILSVILLAGSLTVFAAGVQAPFSPYLSSFCGSSESRWGVKAMLSRDIALGDNYGERADNVIFKVLNEDTKNDPDIIVENVRNGLASEFGVEKNAFQVIIRLCSSEEEGFKEYDSKRLTADDEIMKIIEKEDGTVMIQNIIIE